MSVVIERVKNPVRRRKQVTIVIEADPVEVALQKMVDAAKEGRVSQGALHFGPYHCTLGLIEVVADKHPL